MRALQMNSCVIITAIALAMTASVSAVINTVSAANQIGITPESLTVAGLHTSADDILAQLESASTAREALEQQQLAADQLRRELAILAQQRWNNQMTEELLTLEAQKEQALESIESQIAAIRADLFETATDGVAQQAVEKLTAWRSGAAYGAPAEFRVAVRSHQEWKAIIRALRAVDRDAMRDPEEDVTDDYETLMQQHRNLLATLQADFDVIEAQINLQNHLGDVQTTFDYYETAESEE